MDALCFGGGRAQSVTLDDRLFMKKNRPAIWLLVIRRAEKSGLADSHVRREPALSACAPVDAERRRVLAARRRDVAEVEDLLSDR